MATLRLSSGVTISTDNPSIAQQYLKYGAVEVKEDIKVKNETPIKEKKSTKKTED